MKVLCLTTKTTHHDYFISKLVELCDHVSVVHEANGISPPYDVGHKYEQQRDDYEMEIWGDTIRMLCPNKTSYNIVDNINGQAAYEYLQRTSWDVCIVFGSRRIAGHILHVLPDHSYNLHGGDPTRYRGLDSHLWSIWHGDGAGLATSLHKITPNLDEGAVFKTLPIPLSDVDQLFKLRARNTETCLRLVDELLTQVKTNTDIILKPQKSLGRYYSFMPSVIKDVCNEKFPALRRILINEV